MNKLRDLFYRLMERVGRLFVRFKRPVQGRFIAGVCHSLAQQFNLDLMFIRLAFLLLIFASGIGFIIYGLLWFLFPSEESDVVIDPATVGFYRGIGAKFKRVSVELKDSLKRSKDIWEQENDERWPLPFSKRWWALAIFSLGVFVLLTSLNLFFWITPIRLMAVLMMILGVGLLIGFSARDDS